MVVDTNSGKILNYRTSVRYPKYKKGWGISSANEFGRLTNRLGGHIKGTNTIKFVHKSKIPSNRMKAVIYGQFMCIICPKKAKQN